MFDSFLSDDVSATENYLFKRNEMIRDLTKHSFKIKKSLWLHYKLWDSVPLDLQPQMID